MSRRAAAAAILGLPGLLALLAVVGADLRPLGAGETTCVAMARSLVADGDLVLARADVERLLAERPPARRKRPPPAVDLVVTAVPGEEAPRFGAALPYPLLLAPFVALAGARGPGLLGALLLTALAVLVHLHLRRGCGPLAAAALAAGWVVLGASFVRGLRAGPDALAAVAAALALHLVLDHAGGAAGAGPAPWRGSARAAVAGAALALGAATRPVVAVLALPLLLALRRDRRGVSLLLAGAAAAAAGVAVLAGALDVPALPGSAPLREVHLRTTESKALAAIPVLPGVSLAPDAEGSGWRSLRGRGAAGLLRDARDLLLGRHGGLLAYYPLAVLALLCTLRARTRSPAGVAVLAAVAAGLALGVLRVPPAGAAALAGPGPLGPPLFAALYPALAWAVTAVSAAGTAAAIVAAALVAGPLALSAAGDGGTGAMRQRHASCLPFRALPLEVETLPRLDGYTRVRTGAITLHALAGAAQARDAELLLFPGLAGTRTAEVWLTSAAPLDAPAVFRLRIPPSERDQGAGLRARTVRLSRGGERHRAELGAGSGTSAGAGDDVRTVELGLAEPVALLASDQPYTYRFQVRTTRPVLLGWAGTARQRAADLYAVEWRPVEVPAEAAAGSTFTVTARLVNRSAETWPAAGVAAVHLCYHWLDAEGKATVVREGERTPLEHDVPAGAVIAQKMWVQAPPAPGLYTLELDLVHEGVAWFSDRRPSSARRDPVRVVAAVPEPRP